MYARDYPLEVLGSSQSRFPSCLAFVSLSISLSLCSISFTSHRKRPVWETNGLDAFTLPKPLSFATDRRFVGVRAMGLFRRGTLVFWPHYEIKLRILRPLEGGKEELNSSPNELPSFPKSGGSRFQYEPTVPVVLCIAGGLNKLGCSSKDYPYSF